MLFSLPLDKLALIAAGGGVVGLTLIYAVRNRVTNQVSNEEFFVEAVKRLKEHQGAKHILGTPIITKEWC